MRILAVGFAALTLFAAVPDAAEARPGGCLKYGLGGAVAGHFAGGHRWKGAAAGCALGIVQRRRYDARERARQEQLQQRRQDDRIAPRRRYEEEPPVARRRYDDPRETGSIRRDRDFETDGNFLRRRDNVY